MSPPAAPEDGAMRCCACLFELPKGVSLLPQDVPLSSTFKPNSPKDNEHMVSPQLLGDSIRRGCLACSRLKAALKEHYEPLKIEVEDMYWDNGGFYVAPRMDAWDAFTLAADDYSSLYDYRQSSATTQGYHPYLGKYGVPSGDTSSEKALGHLRGWLSRCEEHHSHCGGLEPKVMPHRVIEIQDYKTPRVRVIDSRDMHEKYVCLSHRWCPETKVASLLRGNFADYTERVPDAALYPLLKDTILIAGILSVKFLWIDCLCIIQDDPEDWNIEASTMAAIYENAFLTISASGWEGGNSLFDRFPPHYAQLNSPGTTDVFVRPQLEHPVWRRPEHHCEFSTSPEYPLARRAWVYQERTLSKRNIHYTRQELVWECMESIKCECKSNYAPMGNTSSAVVPFKQFPLRDYFMSPWHSIVATFSMLDLTFGGDRLPSLSGVAKRYGNHHGLTYLAGMWQESLKRDFFWRRGVSPLAPRLRPNFSPTWSWASITGHAFPDDGLDFRRHENPCEFLTFHGHDVEAVPGGDEFGKLLKANLYVSGPVLFGTLAYAQSLSNPKLRDLDRCNFYWEQTMYTFHTDYDYTAQGPDYISSGEPIACLLLHVHHDSGRRNLAPNMVPTTGIVLRPVKGLKLTFERIGFFHGTPFPDFSGTALEGGKIAKDIHITLI